MNIFIANICKLVLKFPKPNKLIIIQFIISFAFFVSTHLAGGAGHDAGAGALEELRELPRARRRSGLRHVADGHAGEGVDGEGPGKFCKILKIKFLQIFGGLVLGCIKTCEGPAGPWALCQQN